jgi:hypothetical protein
MEICDHALPLGQLFRCVRNQDSDSNGTYLDAPAQEHGIRITKSAPRSRHATQRIAGNVFSTVTPVPGVHCLTSSRHTVVVAESGVE